MAMNPRPRFVERANVLIALRACDRTAPCARNFLRGVEAAVLSRNPFRSAREDTRRYTVRRQKIDCPSFGKCLFWPPYRLLNADEFSALPPILGVTKKMQSVCEIELHIAV